MKVGRQCGSEPVSQSQTRLFNIHEGEINSECELAAPVHLCLPNGRLINLNLDRQWTDSTGSIENGVCIDGRLHKLSTDLTWQYDKTAFMHPWRISDPTGRLALTFTLFLERVAASNVWLVRSEVHQIFGHYDGFITTNEGEVVPVNRLVGWAEDHVALW